MRHGTYSAASNKVMGPERLHAIQEEVAAPGRCQEAASRGAAEEKKQLTATKFAQVS